jgi:hypothetical protein
MVASEWSWIWKEAIVAYSKKLSQYLRGLIETSHKISWDCRALWSLRVRRVFIYSGIFLSLMMPKVHERSHKSQTLIISHSKNAIIFPIKSGFTWYTLH